MQRYRATIDTQNEGSQRLVEHLGSTQVREVKAADAFKGSVRDDYVHEREGEGGQAKG